MTTLNQVGGRLIGGKSGIVVYAPPPPPPTNPNTRGNWLGFSMGHPWNTGTFTRAQRYTHMSQMVNMGFTWIRTRGVDDQRTAEIVEDARAIGIRICLMAPLTNGTTTAQAYDRGYALANNFNPDAIELGNEHNFNVMFFGNPNMQKSMDLMAACLDGTQAAGYTGAVCTNGLAPYSTAHNLSDGTKGPVDIWVPEYLANPDLAGIDGWGFHPYGYPAPPTTAGQYDNRHGMYMMEELMYTTGNHKVWKTEEGWPISGSGSVTVANRRTYLVQACQRCTNLTIPTRDRGNLTISINDLRPLFIFCWIGDPDNTQSNFAMYNYNGTVVDQATIDALSVVAGETVS